MGNDALSSTIPIYPENFVLKTISKSFAFVNLSIGV
jgi:hypothetical protein